MTFTKFRVDPEPGAIVPLGPGQFFAVELERGGFPGLRFHLKKPSSESFDGQFSFPLEREGTFVAVEGAELWLVFPDEAPEYDWQTVILTVWHTPSASERIVQPGRYVQGWREGSFSVSPLTSAFIGDWVHNVPWGGSIEPGRRAFSQQERFIGYIEGTWAGSTNQYALLYTQNAAKNAQRIIRRVLPSQVGAVSQRAIDLTEYFVPFTAWRWQISNGHPTDTIDGTYLIGTSG